MINSIIKNSEILKRLALLGEGDAIAISGLRSALPEGVDYIDLAVTDNLPSLSQMVKLIMSSAQFSEATLANEADDSFKGELKDILMDVKTSELSLRQLQVVAKNARFVIRTGDTAKAGLVVLRV